MTMHEPGGRPHHTIQYGITDDEAEKFLRALSKPDSELRKRLETENPRAVLLDYNIDIAGIPDRVSLPPAEEIQAFVDKHLRRSRGQTARVGYAILYFMLGAMPLVVAEGDAAP